MTINDVMKALGKVFKGGCPAREDFCLNTVNFLTSFLDIVLAKMPSYKNIDSYLDQIQKDKTPVLGLTVGKHSDVTPGVKIPKAGMSLVFSSKTPYMTYNEIYRRSKPPGVAPPPIPLIKRHLPHDRNRHRRSLPLLARPRSNPALGSTKPQTRPSHRYIVCSIRRLFYRKLHWSCAATTQLTASVLFLFVQAACGTGCGQVCG